MAELPKEFRAIIVQLERIAVALETIAYSQIGAGAQEGALPAGETWFDASEIAPDLLNGELYWKIKGPKFPKFGVRVWPEVLEEAGFRDLDIRRHPLPGKWRAHFVANENGNPQKVTRLERLPQTGPLSFSGPLSASSLPTGEPPAVRGGLDFLDALRVLEEHIYDPEMALFSLDQRQPAHHVRAACALYSYANKRAR